MMLEQLVHSVELGLKDLGRRLLQPNGRECLLDEMDRLTTQLQQRYQQLTASQRELAAVKRRLRDSPAELALLHSRIESMIRSGQMAKAWNAALTLDLLRCGLTADEAACPRLEQRCWSLHFHIRQLQRRLDCLLDELSPS